MQFNLTQVEAIMKLSAIIFHALCLLLLEIVSESKSEAKSFNNEVRKLLPDDDFNKLYSVNLKNDDEFKKALEKGIQAEKDLGFTVSMSFAESNIEAGEKFDIPNLSPKVVFNVYGDTVARFLKMNGLLTSGNKKQLAKSYVKELEEAAKTLQSDEEFSSTLPTLLKATLKFLMSVKKPFEEDDLRMLVSIVNDESKKYVHKN